MKANKLVIDTCVFVEGLFGEEGNPSSILLSSLDSINARLIFSQDTIGELFHILKRECNNLQMSYDEISDILQTCERESPLLEGWDESEPFSSYY